MTEFLAGCCSGFIQTIVGHPIDTIKILQQTKQPFYTNIRYYYNGISYPMAFNLLCSGATFDIHTKYYRHTHCHYRGGFFTGLTVAPIIYFFDAGKIHYQLNPNTMISLSRFKNINGMGATMARESFATSFYMGIYFNYYERYGPFAVGGFAGLMSWVLTYPLDVIKTRQMNNTKLTFVKAAALGNVWNGFTACAIRAVIVNAAGFWGYDKTVTFFN